MAWGKDQELRLMELRKEVADTKDVEDNAWNKGSGRGAGGKGKGKSKGKDSGMGKGRNKGMGKGPRPGDWLCHEAGCDAQGQLNFGSRSWCRWCSCPWRPRPGIAHAEDIKKKEKELEDLVRRSRSRSRSKSRTSSRSRSATKKKLTWDDEWITPRKAKKRAKQQAKKDAKAEEVQEGAGKEDSMIVDDMVELALKDVNNADRKKLGVGTLLKSDFRALMSWPSETNAAAKSPADIVAEAAACKSATAVSEKDKEIDRLKQYVTNAADTPGLQTSLQTSLDAAVKEREIMTKKGKDGNVGVEKLRLNLARVKADEEERTKGVVEARRKHLERTARYKTVLEKQVEAARAELDAFDSMIVDYDAKVTEDQDAKAAFHTSLCKEWETKIKETAGTSPAESSTPPTVEAVAPTPDASASASAPTVEQHDPDHLLKAAWSAADLPVLKVPSDEVGCWLSQVWAQLQIWNENADSQMLYKELAGAGPHGVLAIQELLGKTFWDKLYSGRAVTPDDVVPVQLKFLLTFTLGTLAREITANADHAGDVKAAEAAFQARKKITLKSRKADKKSTLKEAHKVKK